MAVVRISRGGPALQRSLFIGTCLTLAWLIAQVPVTDIRKKTKTISVEAKEARGVQFQGGQISHASTHTVPPFKGREENQIHNTNSV